MSLNTIIEILDTYRTNTGEPEVMIPVDVLDAMVEHLEKMNEPQSDREQLVEAYDKLDILQLTCPDERLRPIIAKFVTDAMGLMFNHKFPH